MRGSQFASFQRAFKRKSFDIHERLDVVFVDMDNTSEAAADRGGPTREFLCLLLHDIFATSLFEGPSDAKQLSLSTRGCSPPKQYLGHTHSSQ